MRRPTARELAALDRQIAGWLPQTRWQPPFQLALYRDGDDTALQPNTRWIEAARQGRFPLIKGRTFTLGAVIDDRDPANLTGDARYLVRLFVAYKYDRPLYRLLLAHPPSRHPGARNLAAANL